MGALTTSTTDGVLVLTLDLPGESVNKIIREVRDELEQAFERLRSDSSLNAAVLISGKKDNFLAGADIDEFVALKSEDEARTLVETGQELINGFGKLGKPVVAAIDGVCLGGGLETALACSYRIATNNPRTSLGLPEIQIGILPAAGGCQRLPRLIGLRAAMDIILAGKSVNGKKALRLGLIDDLVHVSELEAVAIEAAKRLAGGWKPVRKSTGFVGFVLEKTFIGRALVFSMARKQTLKKTHGNYPAPLAAIDAIAVGLSGGIRKGLAREAYHFSKLSMGEVSRNLVRIFFATSSLKKDSGVDGDVTPVRVKSLGIVGAGFMGAGIGAVAALQAGSDVRFQESEWDRLAAGIGHARGEFRKGLKRRRLTKQRFREVSSLVSGTTDWSGFERAEVVIEAVFEDLKVKHEVFKKLEKETRPNCVLASNTSTIPIADIASSVSVPERVIGMHFFSPVERMPLLEVIVTSKTSPSVTATAVAYGRQLGKTVIVVQDRPGFWVNRILTPYLNEAGRLLEEGVRVETLDKAMVSFGFPVGPITLLDEVGLDIGVKASSVMFAAFGERMKPLEGMQRLVDSGRLGRKSGNGFFRYEKGKRKGVDPFVYTAVRKNSGDVPVSRDVHDRLVYSMLNEAGLAFQEGVVRSARDGDIGAIFGIGYPAFLGGPLRYLDTIGASRVLDVLGRLEDKYGERFKAAEIFKKHASSGGSFHENQEIGKVGG